MTLQRQLVLGGALIFGLALLGIAVGQWQAGREFLREQMAAHTQETATALALSLSSALRDSDPALVRTTVLPVFDRGYYRRIRVSDVDDRTVDEEIADGSDTAPPPRWFAAMAGLEAPHAEAKVIAGWRQAGRVEVDADTQFALRQLWHGTTQALLWLLTIYLLALLLLRQWLRRLLAPMAAVERIASAAAARRITPIALQTRVRELANFIAGFNRLVDLVNSRLHEEERRAEHFRDAALTDRLTGLPNRHGLEVQLAGNHDALWLGLIEAGGVEEINRRQGYGAGDDFIRRVGECIRQTFADATLARLHAATFAVVLGESSEEKLHQLSADALAAIDEITRNALAETTQAADSTEATKAIEVIATGAGSDSASPRPASPVPHGAAGWTALDSHAAQTARENDDAASPAPSTAPPATLLGSALAAADQVLAAASANGRSHIWIRHEAPAPHGLGNRAMIRWVEHAISDGNFTLAVQPVIGVGDHGAVLQSELFLRLHGPHGDLLAAQHFFPLVLRERDGEFIDRAMLERVRRAVDGGQLPPGPLAVNLSLASFRSGRLPDWLLRCLERWPATHRLVFELREGDATAALDAAERFAHALPAGCAGVAIDHFGLHAGGVAAMRRLLPQYVKLDASLSQRLDAVERRFQVDALVRSAHSLDIPVWAQVFDSPGALDVLAEMGVVGAQGYTLAGEQLLPPPVPADTPNGP
ncbi:EAL domain-containing protein [Rhodocyclus tenuis]|uniref:EAL domain-containing protein n=1 Tax=Rhodocyclus gracilis TaxID=2929842 RepID=A0ABX0WHA6_9RHOO|nr:EAL domain-containing protein [Rhodocyclus gracilis]NJA88730.1 EAL domain-containing protein [Rhodocyclus gracilis]